MSKHTPTPWTLNHVAKLTSMGDHEFILRAVNAHDALVGALRTLLTRLDQTDSVIRATEREIENAQDALALAKGE